MSKILKKHEKIKFISAEKLGPLLMKYLTFQANKPTRVSWWKLYIYIFLDLMVQLSSCFFRRSYQTGF